eukprot:TRINITY_DN671_c0_g1_i3.p1 TRINITY_DN671_c0_g1~~TRINITY_DN671_c0_g1_i3.p1  ORF type:complete len:246 (-),score=61.04 TRINITY_DN671_c0_g1_i3:328-1065(-)
MLCLCSSIKITDAGDIDASLELEEAHERLAELVGRVCARGGIPFVIGGGNDQSYPNACGAFQHPKAQAKGLAVINLDAHLDVRPLREGRVHSGSPFRQWLEDKRFHGAAFAEFAAQGFQCAGDHADYVIAQGGSICWLKDVLDQGAVGSFNATAAKVLTNAGALFVSFDLDCVRSADAPGVSAASPIGLSSDDALKIAMSAGQNVDVVAFDLSEFNPAAEEYRTGRLVTAMFYHFCLGVAMRHSV